MNKNIVIVMGYPAAGKSTHVVTLTDQGYHRINRDVSGGSLDDQAKLADAALSVGKSVVLDNTYPSVESRKSIIAVAKKHKVPIYCHLLDSSMEDAQLNACLRMMKKHGTILNPEDFKSNKDANTFPIAVIYKYRKEFQTPTNAEGFNRILVIPFVRIWGPEYKNKAIIVDYDGTLRLSTGPHKYPTKKSEITILPNRMEVLCNLRGKGYLILGASNQSGVAKGILTDSDCNYCFIDTNKMLGNVVDHYLYCPHKVPPITCYCRKPNCGMGAYFIEKYKLNPSLCIMVGDMGSDKSFAARCGFQYSDQSIFFK